MTAAVGSHTPVGSRQMEGDVTGYKGICPPGKFVFQEGKLGGKDLIDGIIHHQDPQTVDFHCIIHGVTPLIKTFQAFIDPLPALFHITAGSTFVMPVMIPRGKITGNRRRLHQTLQRFDSGPGREGDHIPQQENGITLFTLCLTEELFQHCHIVMTVLCHSCTVFPEGDFPFIGKRTVIIPDQKQPA